jgi:nitroreductase
MELFEVMRTTFSAREFTADAVDDATLYRLIDEARFASSGGNRQGWHVIVVREQATREALVRLVTPPGKLYSAQVRAGESPWNTIDPTTVDAATVAETPAPRVFTEPLLRAPVVLLICLDLRVVASVDRDLERIGVVSGASVYPFAWNILLAARHEGLGGTLTTMPVVGEGEIQELLGIPPHVAVAAVIPMGRPVKQLTKLRRKPVQEITSLERWGGAPLQP